MTPYGIFAFFAVFALFVIFVTDIIRTGFKNALLLLGIGLLVFLAMSAVVFIFEFATEWV